MIGANMFNSFLSDLFGSKASTKSSKPTKPNVTIEVAKPYCMPARNHITGLFKQYGIKLHGYKEAIEYVEYRDRKVPGYRLIKVTVSAKQAIWAEYLLLRSKKYMLWSTPLHPRNLEWATKHKSMPPSWNGKPMIEKSCEEGIKALKEKKK